MLRRFFSRPKWQHRDPRVRVEGVLELSCGDPLLLQLAQSDPDPAVRREAVRQLCDPALLDDRSRQDADDSVRQAARKRLCRVLSGEDPTDLAPDARESAARRYADEAAALYLLAHADAEGVRRCALERTDRASALEEAALSDPSGELRLAALDRIDHLPSLERVARLARGRDKRVARLAREKSEALRAVAERPRRQREVAEALEQLVAAGVPDLVRFRHLESEWSRVREEAPAELEQRVTAASGAFGQLYAADQAAAESLQRQRELCERAEVVSLESHAPNAGGADLANIRRALELLEASWATLVAEEAGIDAACARRFADAVARVQRRLPEVEALREAAARFEGLVGDARQLADGTALPSERAIAALADRWKKLASREPGAVPAGARDSFDAALGRAAQRVRQARDDERRLAVEFDGFVDELEAAIAAGELQHASSLHDRARARLEKLAVLGPRQAAREKRLRRSTTRLRELRDWRRYGVDQVREDLTRQMQSLVGADLSPPRLAARIRKLQEEWRQLDRQGGPAPEPAWQAFHAAAEQAREPCDRHFAEQAAAHEATAAARSAFCDELDAALDAMNPEEPDWAGLDRRARDARRRWRELGGVDPERWTQLDKRFRALMARFDERLGPERERERQRREQLIARLEGLAAEPDLRKALAAVKAAQQAWSPTVPDSRKAEQALWKRFRAAADAVFARREAAREEAERETAEQLARRTALCDEMDRIALQVATDRGAARARRDALCAEWAALEAPPSRTGAGLEKRFAAAMADFERADAQAARRAEAGERSQWAVRAALCEGLEDLPPGDPGAPEACAAARREWAGLPPLADTALQDRFDERFGRACAVLDGEGDVGTTVRDSNLTRCRQLCLELEIAAGLESPAEFADARLALQVSRLSRAMTSKGGAEPDPGGHTRELLGEWYATGPVEPGQRVALRQRFQRIEQALAGSAAAPSD